MVLGIAFIVFGACLLMWMLTPGFARQREHDRAMPWVGNGETRSWERKVFASLPLNVDRALQMTIAVLLIAGGIWYASAH
jgi:hypothetical protein